MEPPALQPLRVKPLCSTNPTTFLNLSTAATRSSLKRAVVVTPVCLSLSLLALIPAGPQAPVTPASQSPLWPPPASVSSVFPGSAAHVPVHGAAPTVSVSYPDRVRGKQGEGVGGGVCSLQS